MHNEPQIQAPQKALGEKNQFNSLNNLGNTRKGSRDRQTAIQLSPEVGRQTMTDFLNYYSIKSWLKNKPWQPPNLRSWTRRKHDNGHAIFPVVESVRIFQNYFAVCVRFTSGRGSGFSK